MLLNDLIDEGMNQNQINNYLNAVELIKTNAFNIQLVDIKIIDIRLMRLVRKQNIWAADAYCPKNLKKDWNYIIFDHCLKPEKADIE